MSRRRTAFHEAGHATAAYVLGGPVDLVSIRPGKEHGGIAWCEGPDWDTASELLPHLPVTMQPRDLRDNAERKILVSLAGDAAGRMVPRSPDEKPLDLIPPDVSAAEHYAAELEHLSPRHRELLVNAGDERDAPDDRERAEKLARALDGDAPRLYVEWLAAVAARLVQDCRPMIEALADELLRRTEVPGDEAVALMEQARTGRKGST